MSIKIQYENLAEVPEKFRELYEEKDGKAVLVGVEGMKTPADVDAVLGILRKERDDRKKIESLSQSWKELGEPNEIREKLDRIPELEEAAKGKIDDEKLNELVEKRLPSKLGPLQRDLEAVRKERDETVKERESLRREIETRDRNDAVRSVASKMSVHSTAMPDIEMAASVMLERDETGRLVTKSGIPDLTPGLEVDSFMREMQRLRPHWWPASSGGGARGSGNGLGGPNPWDPKTFNLTEQGKIMREKGPEYARKLAQAVGSDI